MSDRSGRHEHYEVLISASLSGDLSAAEQAELEAHLRECAICRATMAAFAEQRRMVGGLRHIAPPRDLNARLRGRIAAGAALPWWRRPAAVIAGMSISSPVK
jgi:anti-sigma factor RsiW